MDSNEPKAKKASKTTKIYRRDVDLVEVNLPECSNINSGQSINVNLTKHISFSMEKDGGISVDDKRKDLSVIPEKVAVETDMISQVTDKEIQTSLVNKKEKSSSSIDVPKAGQIYGQGVPVLINLNAFRRRNRRKKVTTARKKPRIKKRIEANKENLPVQEKSGDPVSEAESFEYMPGHIYNQNKINRDETRPHQSAGNKSSLESSGVVTTDSSKESKKSFTKDLEKSINLLKGALQKRYNDSSLKERLIKEVVQRLLKANYRDEDSTTEFLSGLSFSSKKIGLTEDPTTSTSDTNNTAEAKLSRPKKSILRSDKFNINAVASTSQSAPNLASMSNSEPVTSSFAKTLLTSNTESDASSKEKTSSEELYQKYLEALKKEEAYKKHLRDKEMFLKQKRICSDGTFKFPSQLDVKSQNILKNLMKDLTRNNYDDGSGDASKLEGGTSSSINVRYPMGIKQRSHSVFTLSSGNPESPKKVRTKKGEVKESTRRNKSPQAGPSRKEGAHSIHPPSLKFCDSFTQVDIKPDKLKHQNAPSTVVEEDVKATTYSKPFPHFLLDPNGEIKYVCVCNDIIEDIPKVSDNFKIYKCSRLDAKCIQPQDTPASKEVMQSQHDVQTSIPETHTNSTKPNTIAGKDCGIFSKCSQTNLEYEDYSSKGNRCTDVYWVHEGIRCIQTEISIDPKIPEACLSDIKMISDLDCAQLIYEQYRQKSKSSINTETSKTVSSENCNALVTTSSGTCARRVSLELYRPATDYRQGNRQQMECKDNFVVSQKLMVSVGTNAGNLIKTPLKIASQATITDQIRRQDNGTSLIEECSKGNQCHKTPEPSAVHPSMTSADYVVNTLFRRELEKPIDTESIKKPFLRSNTDSNLLKPVGIRNEILDIPNVTVDKRENQNQSQGHNTYPLVENRYKKTKPEDDRGKFELQYSRGCDHATYHGVIEIMGASRKCYDCQDPNCQGGCKKNETLKNNKSNFASDQDSEKCNKSNKCTDTDSINVSNKIQSTKSSTCKKTCGENNICKKQTRVSYFNATCSTAVENLLDERKDYQEAELSDRLGDEKAEPKKLKGSLRFAYGEDDSRIDSYPGSLEKNVPIEPCLSNINTTPKKNCVFPENTDLKVTCDMTKGVEEEFTAQKELRLNKAERSAIKNTKGFVSRTTDTVEFARLDSSNSYQSSGEDALCIEKSTIREEAGTINKEPSLNCRGTSPIGKATSSIGGSTSPISRSTSPPGRATSPIGRATSPIGRATSAIGRATSPNGRATNPIGRATSPISRATSPIQRDPVRRETSPRKSPNPVRRDLNMEKELPSDDSPNGKISSYICSPTANCGGYCTKTKCMISRPKLEVRNSSPHAKPKTPIQKRKGDHVETDFGKSDSQTLSEEKKSSSHGPESSECGGTCGKDASAVDINNTKLNADVNKAQEDKGTLRTLNTSANYTEDSGASSSKNLIKEMIQDVTRRYSKKSIHKSEKKKCFKEVMALLNYLLDTEESTDADIVHAVESSVSEKVTTKKKTLIGSNSQEQDKKTQNTHTSKNGMKKQKYSDSSSPDTQGTASPHVSGSESCVRCTVRSTTRQFSPARNRVSTRNTSRALDSAPVWSKYRNSDTEHKSSSGAKNELKKKEKKSLALEDINTEKKGTCNCNRRYRDESVDEKAGEKAACACDNHCGGKNCSCEKKKSVKDVGVQLDSRKRYRDWYAESSDIPISTDLPSSDSATCKVLNKIKKECEKYQQRRCKFHHTKRCEVSSSTSLSCEQCKCSYHCQWKQHRCKSCKKAEKKKNVGYNLFFQTSDSVISEEPSFANPCRPQMKNIILKVPRKGQTLGQKVPFEEITCNIQKHHQSPRGDGKTRSKSAPNNPTVRDYLEQNRPDFIQQCVTRQQCLKIISASRLVQSNEIVKIWCNLCRKYLMHARISTRRE